MNTYFILFIIYSCSAARAAWTHIIFLTSLSAKIELISVCPANKVLSLEYFSFTELCWPFFFLNSLLFCLFSCVAFSPASQPVPCGGERERDHKVSNSGNDINNHMHLQSLIGILCIFAQISHQHMKIY